MAARLIAVAAVALIFRPFTRAPAIGPVAHWYVALIAMTGVLVAGWWVECLIRGLIRADALQARFGVVLWDEMKVQLPLGVAVAAMHYTGDAEYCAPWTLLGVPAVTLPAGFGKHGLPLGLQIVADYHGDLRLLRVAKWVETVLNFDPGSPSV